MEELVDVVMGGVHQIPQGVEAAWSVLPETPNTQAVGQLGPLILTKQHDQLAYWKKNVNKDELSLSPINWKPVPKLDISC